MSGFLYKPIGQGQLGGGRGVFRIEDLNLVSGGWYDKQGNLIERFERFQNPPEHGQNPAVKFTAQKPGHQYAQDLEARFTDKDGKVHTFNIANPGLRWEAANEDPSTIKQVNKGPTGGGMPGQFAPGQSGDYGAFPAYIGGMFPQAVLAAFNSIKSAPYNFTDPTKFAESFGAFNRGEIQKNFDTSRDLALKELGTELAGLQNFVPAASALKRNETAIDNQFNQTQRTSQVNAVMPNAGRDLTNQAGRARSFAEGRIPDPVQDRAFELGIRSASADRSAAGGFGATSSVARKSSDLLSASERIQLSKYGDQLLSSNLNQTAGLFLAPTEYSNAGGQINVMPSVSASQLIDRNLAQVGGLASVSATTALGSNIQQNQFTTGQEQQTRQFNALGQYGASQFNATQQNQFALGQFGYNAGYANSVAGAAQTDINTNFQLQQQEMYKQVTQQFMDQSQNSSFWGSIFQGAGALLGSDAGKDALDWASNLFKSSGTGSTVPDFSYGSPESAADIFAQGVGGGAPPSNPGASIGGAIGGTAGAYYGGPVGQVVGEKVGETIGPAIYKGVTKVVETVGDVS